jgi:hypothetical protein
MQINTLRETSHRQQDQTEDLLADEQATAFDGG